MSRKKMKIQCRRLDEPDKDEDIVSQACEPDKDEDTVSQACKPDKDEDTLSQVRRAGQRLKV
jgi:hypothetical protein